jgi:Ala-tRNA(Pro) deacylase
MTMRLDEHLIKHHVHFERLRHRPTFTANRMAQMLHVPGKEVAKSVLLRAGAGYVLAVLPATHQVDLGRVREELGEEKVELASEREIERLFPDCEAGSRPPFGSLYNMQTLMDESLTKDAEIVFEGQNHEEAYRMSFLDYEALEHPRKGFIARHI